MSLVGVKAKNHPQPVRKRGVDYDGDHRQTPDDLWLPLHAEFGFTMDAAATFENTKVPSNYCSLNGYDGLRTAWAGERVWCNPPFSDMRAWIAKASLEATCGCPLIVMLVPANRTEQRWWQEWVEPYRDRGGRLSVRFLPGRVRFHRPGWTKPTKGDRPPFGVALLIWSNPIAGSAPQKEQV